MKCEIQSKNLFVNDKQVFFDGIDFINELGDGTSANARAFLVKNIQLQRYEVIKLSKPRQAKDKPDYTRFISEVRKNALFHHKQIAVIYDAVVKNELFFCKMQYFEGCSLKEFLETDAQFIIRYSILESLLGVLDEVYTMEQYHGDIHGNNIIINDNIPYLIDFGTSLFSGKIASHRRDAKMLFAISFEVLPELIKMSFITKDIIDYGSHAVCEIIRRTAYMLFQFENRNLWNNKVDLYTQKEQIIIPISILHEDFPFISKCLITRFLANLPLDDDLKSI